MKTDLIARASTTVNASRERVWKALTDQAALKAYMFGATVSSEWKQGSPITWSGEWKGKPYQDKGTVLEADPGRRLQYTHFSAMSGKPDRPENDHTVTIELSGDGPQTRVTLSQDNNETLQAQSESEKNWGMMLEGLKKYVEKSGS